MSSTTKKLIFKGLEKKEQILFKSFLNLAKNDLSYEVELIQDPDAPLSDADLVIADAGYALSADEKKMSALPTIKIGDDINLAGEGYLLRPVQWSDFKDGLAHVSFDGGDELFEDQRVLPNKVALEIGDEDDSEEDFDENEEVSRSFSEVSDYNFSLDKMSIDYHSFTNSDYQKVVDDVKGFTDKGAEASVQIVDDVANQEEQPQAVMLVTDDESNSSNSVLVIETNSLDAWDMNDSEFDDIHSVSVETPSQLELPELEAKERKEVRGKIASGTQVTPNTELWMTDQEVMAGARTLFYVRANERKVYSTREPAKWIKAMRTKELTCVDLVGDWRPNGDLKAYPLERLIWVNTLVGRNEKLDDEVTDNDEFMLMSWPHFELLELDNNLLKITTMLFVGPESAYSLMQKTGESRAVVYGMMNACKELGMLVSPDQIKDKGFTAPAQEEGMFGKIKDVFR